MGLRRIRSAPSGPEYEVWEGPLPPPAVGTWAQVLATGPNSGANDPIVDPGQKLIASRLESNPGQFFQLITPNGQPRATTYLQFVTGVGPDGSGDVDISAGSLVAPGMRGGLSLDYSGVSILATNSPLDTNPIKGTLRLRAGDDPAQPNGLVTLESNALDGAIQATINGVLALAFSAGTPANLTTARIGQGLKKQLGDVLAYGDLGANYTFASRAELAAAFPPVGSVFTLPSGLYVLTGEIALNAGESIACAAGSNVTIIAAQSTPGRITGNTATDLFVGSTLNTALLFCRILQNGTGRALDLPAGGAADIIGANISSAGGVAVRSAAFIQSFASRYAGLTASLQASSEIWSFGDTFFGGTTSCVEITGSAAARLISSEVVGAAGGLRTLLLNSTGYVHSIGSRFYGAPTAIELAAVSEFRMVGGYTQGIAGSPVIRIAGNCDYLDLQGPTILNGSAGVLYASGTIGLARFQGCGWNSGATQGINWPAANLPTRGIIEIGNSFNLAAGNAFVGHTATDARVMRRANSLAAGAFASETPFVP